MSNQLTAIVTITTTEGWHARPATEFARIAGESGQLVTIGRVGSEAVRGDSVLMLLTLGARHGEELEITVSVDSGDANSAQQVLESLTALF